MALLRWDPADDTGIPGIDHQHRRLFEALNALHDAIQADRGPAEVQRTLAFLLAYTVAHFRSEEAHMARVGCPGLDAHRAEHAALLAKVALLQARQREHPEAVPPEDLARLLLDWTLEHTLRSDRAHREALRALGWSA